MDGRSSNSSLIAGRRLTRRGLLGSGALALGGAATFVGCRSSRNSTAGGETTNAPGSDAAAAIIGKEWNTSAGTPKYGGTLAYACTVPALANLDPILSASFMVQAVVSNTYSKLMRISHKPGDENAQVIFPDLATGWETSTPTTWTFHLRPGVKFQDVPPTNGRDLNADDVKYSILRAATDKSSQFRGGSVGLHSIETPDPLYELQGDSVPGRAVRKAISLAIDPNALIKVSNDGEGLWRGVMSAQNAGWALSQDELKGKDYFLRQDVGEARQLMAEAGHADGFQTELIYNFTGRQALANLAQCIQQALGAIGIRLNLMGQEQTTFRKNQDSRNYKGFCSGSDGEAFHEAFLLDYRSDGPKNGSGAPLPWLDDAIDQVLATVDENERKAKAKDVTRQILKQVVWKLEYCDVFQYEASQPWAKNWFAPPPQVYDTTGLGFTWIDR